MMRSSRALVIGIDDYPNHPLKGCVNDAIAIRGLLDRDGDGSPNFAVKSLTSQDGVVDGATMTSAIEALFTGKAETVLLYFAGHGVLDSATNSGHIMAQDGRKGAWGMSLADILNLANKAHPHIQSSVVILDSCHSGAAGDVPAIGNDAVSVIGTGVTILTSSDRKSISEEGAMHGVFTEILLDGLHGGASDILGNITPAALYSHVDQTLGAWGQRPVYKANVDSFVTLRKVDPKIPREFLRELPALFPEANALFALDPTYEPMRDGVPDEILQIAPIAEHVRIFKGLQACNRHGLVAPVDAEHMFYAAVESKACRLTAVGAHYRKLAALGHI